MSRLALLALLVLADCGAPAECDPGTQRPCPLALDGGATQRGFQS